MSIDILRYVQEYIPVNGSVIFTKKMDTLLKSIVKQMLRKYVEMKRPSNLSAIIRLFFPEDTIKEYTKSYRALFKADYLIMLFSVKQPYETEKHLCKNLPLLTKQISAVAEGLVTELAETYFLCRKNNLAFWETVDADGVLRNILYKFKIYPLVRIGGAVARPVLYAQYISSRPSTTLLDSFIIALIKREHTKHNGIQTSTT